MEMNTRIQVEHTVTEMVTGVDLVKAQVKVAFGQDLPFEQADIKLLGTAIECRINAEDPAKNFTPSVGKVDYLYFPVGNLGMRIDSDLYAGAKISPYYALLTAVYQQIPAIYMGNDQTSEKGRVVDYVTENEQILTGKQLSAQEREILEDLRLIQYDITAGKNYVKETKFMQLP